jgi:hypothetical protein
MVKRRKIVGIAGTWRGVLTWRWTRRCAWPMVSPFLPETDRARLLTRDFFAPAFHACISAYVHDIGLGQHLLFWMVRRQSHMHTLHVYTYPHGLSIPHIITTYTRACMCMHRIHNLPWVSHTTGMPQGVDGSKPVPTVIYWGRRHRVGSRQAPKKTVGTGLPSTQRFICRRWPSAHN